MNSEFTQKHDWKIDVAVLLIFFARPRCFSQVFEQVKMARPSKLLLYQDGPRKGNVKDVDGIRLCREIVQDIDWTCEVHELYQEKNVGCDPSEYIAQKWAFSIVDRCIILEDDDVPCQSFFPFCKELLDRYANDERINMICGMNNLETWNTPYSYFFTQTGSIWGWATWRRVVENWDSEYSFLSDTYSMDKLASRAKCTNLRINGRIRVWKSDKASGVEHYETLLGANQLLQNSVNIVPAKNMIINIGNTPEGSTHSMSSLKLIPRGLRKIYTIRSFEIGFPLKHPKYVIDDVEYQKELYRVMGTGHPMVQMWRRVEKSFLIAKHEGFSAMIKKIQSSIRK